MGWLNLKKEDNMKAKFIEKFYDNNNDSVLVYEYKGFTYEVIDHGWKGGEPLSWQHKNEQAHIDEMIERLSRPKNQVSEPAQVGFDLFWEYVNQ